MLDSDKQLESTEEVLSTPTSEPTTEVTIEETLISTPTLTAESIEEIATISSSATLMSTEGIETATSEPTIEVAAESTEEVMPTATLEAESTEMVSATDILEATSTFQAELTENPSPTAGSKLTDTKSPKDGSTKKSVDPIDPVSGTEPLTLVSGTENPDRDGDGVPDDEDACPDNGDSLFDMGADGCPLANPNVQTNSDNVKLYVSPILTRVGDDVTLTNYTNAPFNHVKEWWIAGNQLLSDDLSPNQANTVVVQFDTAGDNTVRMIVENPATGATKEISVIVNAQSAPRVPTILFSHDKPNGVPLNTDLTFTVDVTDEDGNAIPDATCQLNMSDGNFIELCSGTQIHQYVIPSNSQAVLTVKVDGQSYTKKLLVMAFDTPEPPSASFALPQIIDTNKIGLINTSTGTYVRTEWTITSHTTALSLTTDELSPIVGLEPDDYTISLKVIGPEPENLSSVYEIIFKMPALESVKAGFNLAHDQCYAEYCNQPDPMTCYVTCTLTITNAAEGEVERTDYDLGNGQFILNADATEQVTFSVPDTYIITQIVEDIYGNIDRIERVVIVEPAQISAWCNTSIDIDNNGVWVDAPAALVGQIVRFTYGMHNASKDDVVAQKWSFDETSTTSTDDPAYYVYDSIGVYSPSLYLEVNTTNGFLTTNIDCGDITITDTQNPIIWLEVDDHVLEMNIDATVNVTPRFIGNVDTLRSWFDFGDGVTLTGFNNRSHTYVNPDVDYFDIVWRTYDGNSNLPIESEPVRVWVFPKVTAVISLLNPANNVSFVTADVIECYGVCYLQFSGENSIEAKTFSWMRQGGNMPTRLNYGSIFNTTLTRLGEYTISLSTGGKSGNPSVDTALIKVNVLEPPSIRLSPSANQYVGKAGFTLFNFDAHPSSLIYTAIRWDFVEGIASGVTSDFIFNISGVKAINVQAISPALNPTANFKVYIYDDSATELQSRFRFSGFDACFEVDNTNNLIITFVLPDGTTIGNGECVPKSLVLNQTVYAIGQDETGKILAVDSLEVKEIAKATFTPTGTLSYSATSTSTPSATPSPSLTPSATPTPIDIEEPDQLEGGGAIPKVLGEAQDLLPDSQYAQIFGQYGSDHHVTLTAGQSIFEVAQNECGTEYAWHKIYYDSYVKYLKTNFDKRISSGKVETSLTNNDADKNYEVGQSVLFTLELTGAKKDVSFKNIVDVKVPSMWQFEKGSVKYRLATGTSWKKVPKQPILLVDNWLSFDVDALFGYGVGLSRNEKLSFQFVLTAPSPFSTHKGDTLDFSCPSPDQLNEIIHIFEKPVAGLTDEQSCHAAQSFVIYVETRANEASSIALISQASLKAADLILSEAGDTTKFAENSRRTARLTYQQNRDIVTALMAEIDTTADLLDGVDQLILLLQNQLAIYPNNASLLTQYEELQSKKIIYSLRLDNKYVQLDDALLALSNSIENALSESQKLDKAIIELQSTLRGLLDSYGGRRSYRNEGDDEVAAVFESLRESALNWQDSACGNDDHILDKDDALVTLNWDIIPYENYCAGFFTEVRYGALTPEEKTACDVGDSSICPFPNRTDNNYQDSYSANICETSSSSACLPPVDAAYQYLTQEDFAPYRYTVSNEFTKIGSDLTQCGIMPGDGIVWDKNQSGSSADYGHICVVTEVLADSVVCVGTSDDDGKLSTTRISRGSIDDLTFLSTQRLADFTFLDANHDKTPDLGLTTPFINLSPYRVTATREDGITKSIPDSEVVKIIVTVADRVIELIGDQLQENGEFFLPNDLPGGTYPVTMTVTRKNGTVTSVTKTVIITTLCLEAEIEIPYTECTALETLNTQNLSSASLSTPWFAGDPDICGWSNLTCTPGILSDGKRHVIELSLSGIGMTGDTLPPQLDQLTYIRSFDVSHNPKLGSADKDIGFALPISWGSWKYMQVFDVSDTSLTGYLPYEYANWGASIREFNASSTRFYGDLPRGYAQKWTNIEKFDVSFNGLDNIVPKDWDKLIARGVQVNLQENVLEAYDHNIENSRGTRPLQIWEDFQTVQPSHVDVVPKSPTQIDVSFTPSPAPNNSFYEVVCTTYGIGDAKRGYFNTWNSGTLEEISEDADITEQNSDGEGGRGTYRNEGGRYTYRNEGGRRSYRNEGGRWSYRNEGGEVLVGSYGLTVRQLIPITGSLDPITVSFKGLTPDTVMECGVSMVTLAHDQQKNDLISRYHLAETTARTESVCEQVVDVSESTCNALVSLHRSTSMAGNMAYQANEVKWFESDNTGEIRACSWASLECVAGDSGFMEVIDINLSNRNLAGELPEDLGDLKLLQSLDVSGNPHLGGSIPARLSELPLEFINISNSNIAGTLPPSLSNIITLKEFIAHDTDINGDLPQSYSALVNMEHFDVSNTNIAGKFADYSAWANIDIFSIAHTHIMDKFPAWIGSWQNASEIYMNDTALEGDVPPSIANLHLDQLDLSYARLKATSATLTYIQSYDSDFAKTQTVTPKILNVTFVQGGDVIFSIEPIPFSVGNGFYEVACYAPDGNFTVHQFQSLNKASRAISLTLEPGWNYLCAVRTFSQITANMNASNDLVSDPQSSDYVDVLVAHKSTNADSVAIADTFISSARPNTNSGGDRACIIGGHIDYTIKPIPTFTGAVCLMRFALPDLTNNEVVSARLVIGHYATTGIGNMDISRILENWNESDSYNIQGGAVEVAAPARTVYVDNYNSNNSPREFTIELSQAQFAKLLDKSKPGELNIALSSSGFGGAVCTRNTDPYCNGFGPRLIIDYHPITKVIEANVGTPIAIDLLEPQLLEGEPLEYDYIVKSWNSDKSAQLNLEIQLESTSASEAPRDFEITILGSDENAKPQTCKITGLSADSIQTFKFTSPYPQVWGEIEVIVKQINDVDSGFVKVHELSLSQTDKKAQANTPATVPVLTCNTKSLASDILVNPSTLFMGSQFALSLETDRDDLDTKWMPIGATPVGGNDDQFKVTDDSIIIKAVVTDPAGNRQILNKTVSTQTTSLSYVDFCSVLISKSGNGYDVGVQDTSVSNGSWSKTWDFGGGDNTSDVSAYYDKSGSYVITLTYSNGSQTYPKSHTINLSNALDIVDGKPIPLVGC